MHNSELFNVIIIAHQQAGTDELWDEATIIYFVSSILCAWPQCCYNWGDIIYHLFVFFLIQNSEKIQAASTDTSDDGHPLSFLVCCLCLWLHLKQCHQSIYQSLSSIFLCVCHLSSLLWSCSGSHIPSPWRYRNLYVHDKFVKTGLLKFMLYS